MNTIREALRAKGYKMTQYREALLELFQQQSFPVSVPDILDELIKRKMKPNKTTVYRELEVLLAEKIVVGVEFGDGKKRYERADLPHHHHLVCRNCNRVKDVDVDVNIASVELRIAKEHKFKDVGHAIEFFGICHVCAS